MKNEVIIITEGEFDAKVLEKLLKSKASNDTYKVVSAGGYSSALSKVKSLLTVRNNKVILILDTDSIDEMDVKEKKDFVKSYINGNADAEKFKMIWSEPEFEIIFLNNKKFLSELLTDTEVSSEMLEIGKASPKRTLEILSKKKRESFIKLLDNKDVRDEFFKENPIKEIYEFIKE